MKNIHIFQTTEPTRLYISIDEYGEELNLSKRTTQYVHGQHIYITSEKKLEKDVDTWYLDSFLNKPHNSGGAEYGQEQSVIILTTNKKLIDDGVQAIDNEFLEWYVKNPNCEYVHINYICDNVYVSEFLITSTHIEYKTIIPQEETKHPKVFSENGSELFFDEKGNLIKEEPKQSVEEYEQQGLEKYSYELDELGKASEHYFKSKELLGYTYEVKDGFIDGAKWQSERMYSEDDLKECFKSNYTPFSATNIGDVDKDFDKWFKQFKKK